MKKSIIVTLVCLMVISAMLFTACGAPAAPAESPATETSASSEGSASKAPTESGGTASAEGIKIGFSFGQSVHPFFVAMQQGAEAAAKEAGDTNWS